MFLGHHGAPWPSKCSGVILRQSGAPSLSPSEARDSETSCRGWSNGVQKVWQVPWPHLQIHVLGLLVSRSEISTHSDWWSSASRYLRNAVSVTPRFWGFNMFKPSNVKKLTSHPALAASSQISGFSGAKSKAPSTWQQPSSPVMEICSSGAAAPNEEWNLWQLMASQNVSQNKEMAFPSSSVTN